MTETIYCAVCGKPIQICASHVPRRATCSVNCRIPWQRKFEIDPEELLLAVWTEPVTTVAASFDVSDKAIEKRCKRLGVVKPPRGYWARIAAGQKPARIPFPVRGLGQTNEVMIGREVWTGREERITELPPTPTFSESLTEVTQRAQKLLGKVTVAKTLANPHPLIAKLLADDEQRRQALIDRPYAWKKPRLQLEISNWAKNNEFPPNLWCDTEETPLESHLPEIAASLLVAGEMLYRGQAIWRHNHLVERKAEQDEKIRQACLLYTSPSPRDGLLSRMPSSA